MITEILCKAKHKESDATLKLAPRLSVDTLL